MNKVDKDYALQTFESAIEILERKSMEEERSLYAHKALVEESEKRIADFEIAINEIRRLMEAVNEGTF